MNITRKILAAAALTLSLGAITPAFAGYWHNACYPYGYCPIYNPTFVCNRYGCFYE